MFYFLGTEVVEIEVYDSVRQDFELVYWRSVYMFSIKVRLRWFGADLVKPLYLCHFSGDLHVLYVK